MHAFLFERPLSLLTVLLVIEFILLWIWANRRTKRWSGMVWLGLILCAALPLVSVMVETAGEKIIALCRSAGKAVDESNVEGLAQLLDEDFRLEHLDKAQFISRVSDTLSRHRVDQARLSGFEVSFTDDAHGIAEFMANCMVRSPETVIDTLPTRWRVNCTRRGERWLIAEVRPVPVPPFHFRDAGHWLR